MSRFLALCYGIFSYALGVAALLALINFLLGLFPLKTIDSGPPGPLGEAVLVDLILVSLFALQHSVMARKGFKRWWTRVVPQAIERSTYVLASGLVLGLLIWQWQPIPAVVWRIDNPALALAVTGLAVLGWVILFSSTFLINHFELFGLHQVANNLIGRSMPTPRFRTPLYYKFVRHPIYQGLIIAFWAAPVMSVGRLLFAVVTTAYIFVGIALEERDLVDLFGDEYRRYRARVAMLVPWRRVG